MSIVKINPRRSSRPIGDYHKDLTNGHLERYQHLLETMDTVAGRTFRYLVERKGQWVGLPELGAVSRTRSFANAIMQLREKGCVLDNMIEWPDDANADQQKSWWRLMAEPKDTLAKRLEEEKEKLL